MAATLAHPPSDLDPSASWEPLKPSLPRCPVDLWPDAISYPSTTLVFILLAVTSIIFTLLTALKYNSVKVFNRRIRRKNISNTFWIVYFISIAIRCACQTVYYAIVSQNRRYMDNLFDLFILILHGISAFALSLALNHQRRHRTKPEDYLPIGNAPSHEERVYGQSASSPVRGGGRSFGKPVPTSLPAGPAEYDALTQNSASSVNAGEDKHPRRTCLKKTILSVEAIFFLLFVVYLVGLYLKLADVGYHQQAYDIAFLAVFVVQRLPNVILAAMIILTGVCDKLSSVQRQRGPSGLSKAGLGIGLCLNLVNEMPVDFWTEIVGRFECVFYVASVVDLMLILFVVSLLFYLLFLRAEYKRNMEDCLWQGVSTTQETTFDFKSFSAR